MLINDVGRRQATRTHTTVSARVSGIIKNGMEHKGTKAF